MPSDLALAEFCEAQYGPLVGMLTLYVGDRDVAQELAQDALVRVCVHWSRVSGMASPAGWVTTVAFNLAKSWFRRRQAEARARQRHGQTPTHAPVADPSTRVAVRTAVASLPPRQRQAVILRYFADLPVADAAAVMGCAPGTVKAHTSRALEALRAHDLHPHDKPLPTGVYRPATNPIR